MPRIFKCFLFCAAIIIAILLLFLVADFVCIKIKYYNLQHADHAHILSACREVIENRHSYRNDKNKWGTLAQDDVLLLPPIPNNIPEAIRELNPHDIIIREDSVLINVSLPGSRLGLIGFKSGAKQYGTSRYIDGLWFWNGNIAPNAGGESK